ncbi:uncharacterized protein ELE39_001081 [Cryptosporidium sp. chipmunk genotype I]|uniref:uncharacterized protein n=1 Tax=Cryptosporidium sp. chipmunk genotype I TaxID=1280935 RepID=UPI00351A5218|nr:hypothetical protein ELE39_001081 [Cryptosporidium sp. chipmunk genotype I]
MRGYLWAYNACVERVDVVLKKIDESANTKNETNETNGNSHEIVSIASSIFLFIHSAIELQCFSSISDVIKSFFLIASSFSGATLIQTPPAKIKRENTEQMNPKKFLPKNIIKALNRVEATTDFHRDDPSRNPFIMQSHSAIFSSSYSFNLTYELLEKIFKVLELLIIFSNVFMSFPQKKIINENPQTKYSATFQ